MAVDDIRWSEGAVVASKTVNKSLLDWEGNNWIVVVAAAAASLALEIEVAVAAVSWEGSNS